jgi:methanogenic corrinoid protein MtbC1
MKGRVSNRIKELRKKDGLTQGQLAELLGVAQTTVANYEQGTRLPDADKLQKMADIFKVSLDYLLNRHSVEQEDRKVILEEEFDEIYLSVINELLEGDKEKARNIIAELYKRKVRIEDIYFKVFEKLLMQVGELWEQGKIEVWKEHFISEFIQDSMREIKMKEKKRKNEAKTILALTAGAELHNIGIRMVMDLLELEGWKVTYLGSNVPVASTLNAIEIEKPKVIAISITLGQHIDAAKNLIGAIREKFGVKSPIIIVGGNVFKRDKNLYKLIGADYCDLSAIDIAKLNMYRTR